MRMRITEGSVRITEGSGIKTRYMAALMAAIRVYILYYTINCEPVNHVYTGIIIPRT